MKRETNAQQMNSSHLAAAVTHIHGLLEAAVSSGIDMAPAVMDMLDQLEQLGPLPVDVLRATRVGKTVNALSKSEATTWPVAVRERAGCLVEAWRQGLRPRRHWASAPSPDAAAAPPAKRTRACGGGGAPEGEEAASRDSMAPWRDAARRRPTAVLEGPFGGASQADAQEVRQDSTAARRHAVRRRLAAALEGARGSTSQADVQEPSVVAGLVEEALHRRHAADGSRQYAIDARSILARLKGDQGRAVGSRVLAGRCLPEDVLEPVRSVDPGAPEAGAQRSDAAAPVRFGCGLPGHACVHCCPLEDEDSFFGAREH